MRQFDREKAQFEREKALVDHLLSRLGLAGAAVDDPKAAGTEAGIDVLVHLPGPREIGIQVTEVDPYIPRGRHRAREKRIVSAAPGRPYGMWGQNNPQTVNEALVNSVTRKIDIAKRHSFNQCDEVWLLICGGIPDSGAVVSTLVMTSWLRAEDVNSMTGNLLSASKYSRCFFLPILGGEQAFYQWERAIGWKKSVELEDIRSIPREAYVKSLLNAANPQEFDRLVDEECRTVLREMRQG